jgi:Zn-dependent peptidase ImmA (M78 family)/transcriptional regulator with XRE-family HTH domain
VVELVNISLQPKLLEWARKRAGLAVADLAELLETAEVEIQTWEKTGIISAEFLEKLADATNTSIGHLYLSNPPDQTLPISDFRTVGGTQIQTPTPDLLDTIYDAQRKQAWFRDHLIDSGAKPLEFVGSIKTTDDVVKTALRIREAVGITTSERTKGTWESALTALIDRIEDFGVLVLRNSAVGIDYRRRLSVGEFRGFALSDEYAPLIFVNSDDAKAAQLFTLAHELVHVWLGVSGISNLSNTYAVAVEVETFCNAVAAEMLVPSDELRVKIQGKPISDYWIARFGTHFRVSGLVIIRRLRDIGVLNDQAFQALYQVRLGRYRAQALKQRQAAKKRDGGPSFYTILLPRVSPRFAHALVGSALEGRTLYRDARNLLGLKSTSPIHEMGKRFGLVT